MAVAGRRAVAILNRTDAATQVKVDWGKLGLDDVPQSVLDVWSGREMAADAVFSVPAHDLVLLSVAGQDKKPAEYSASKSEINGIQATSGPTFARLHYMNTSGRVLIIRGRSSSGLSTAFALPRTAESTTGTLGFILPHGTADLSFDAPPGAIRNLLVYSW